MAEPRTMLLIGGMMRSGTTLLGRMLDAHPQAAVATDPYLPFFKRFRSAISRQIGTPVADDLPLGDYYYSTDQLELFRAIQAASLDVPFEADQLPVLRQEIGTFGSPWAPALMDRLDHIRG